MSLLISHYCLMGKQVLLLSVWIGARNTRWRSRINFLIKNEKEKKEKLYMLLTNFFRILMHSPYLHDCIIIVSIIIITTRFLPPKKKKKLIQLSGGAMYYVYRLFPSHIRILDMLALAVNMSECGLLPQQTTQSALIIRQNLNNIFV